LHIYNTGKKIGDFFLRNFNIVVDEWEISKVPENLQKSCKDIHVYSYEKEKKLTYPNYRTRTRFHFSQFECTTYLTVKHLEDGEQLGVGASCRTCTSLILGLHITDRMILSRT